MQEKNEIASEELIKLRMELDEIDPELLRLFERRQAICLRVAEDKRRTGKAVYDPVREREKIEAIKAMVDGEFEKEMAEEFFRCILSLSKRLQEHELKERD